jgi:hypothetical protein
MFTILFTIIYSISSCSENNEIDNNSIDKTNSMEFKNTIFLPQADGSIVKYENNRKLYTINLNTEITATKNLDSRNSSNTYRITNPNTGEFIDILDIVEKGNYFEFNAITSTGELISNVKYYGNDFETSLDTYANSNNQRVVCPPCVAIIVTAVVTIVDSLQDSPLEQCKNAMQSLNCGSGTTPYMQFSEGWFSTTCNVGCR